MRTTVILTFFVTLFCIQSFGCDQQFAGPQDPLLAQQYYLRTANVPALWKILANRDICEDQTLGLVVIDTGVNISHPDLAGQIDTIWSKDFTGEANPYEDPAPHGTAVIGEMSAAHNDIGIAGVSQKKVIVFRVWKTVIDPNDPPLSSPYRGTEDGILAAIQELKKLPYQKLVVNMSFSYGGQNPAIHDALAKLSDKALFIAVPYNGNDGGAEYPCAEDLPNVICVGSSSDEEGHSSFDYGGNVKALAPGDNIWSTYGDGYDSLSGASLSAPQFAAVANLLWAMHPEKSPAEVAEALTIKNINPTLYSDGLPTLDALISLDALESKDESEKMACIEAFSGNWYLKLSDVISCYGNFTDTEYFTDFVNLPKVLGGIQLLLDGSALPLYYVGPGLINAKMPSNIFLFHPGTKHVLQVGDKNWSFIVK